ncbi:MAG TPA: MFS transporter [Gemmatimonadales bacterium]|nr:MFS transporter [Gemmatimonadales bacterium]
MSDRHLIYLATFVRALATGFIGVLLGVYLAELGLDAGAIGLVVSAGLTGAAAGTFLVTFLGDRVGHRRVLLAVTLLSAAGGVALALSSHPLVLGAAALLGMVNGMGRDRGAALVLEQAVLPALLPDTERTMAFARYNVLQDIGHALGGLAAGLPALLQESGMLTGAPALRWSMAAYAVLSLAPAAAYLSLSRAVEMPDVSRLIRVSPESRRILWKISSLFALDSLAGGFLTTALLSFFFYQRFGVGLGAIGAIFFAARVANAASHIAAASLARRIGLVNTMVFTHIPSSLLLVSVAYASSFPVAAVLFLLREGLVEMDVPTRQSYVMAVVRPEERTVASGVTHLVRMAAWAVAPAFAGVLMQDVSLMLPLVIGAGMKIGYDLLLWREFRHVKPPEELRAIDSGGS